MEPITTATALVGASLPYLEPLLSGAKDRLKTLGKDLTGELIDGLHRFWTRLVQVEPKAKDLVAADKDPAQRQALETLVAEAIAAHPDLAELAAALRPIAQVANQSGGITQITGEKGVNIAGDFNGNLAIA